MAARPAAQALRQAEHLCRERGVRLTPQRRAVLELVCASPRPLSAYEILDRMGDGARIPAPPTVYRALDFLLRQGLVHKLASLHAFIGCAHPEHPHASQFLICAACGEVDELEDEPLMRHLTAAAQAVGFLPEQPVVELLGTCAQCRRKEEDPS